jgi:hypothetical protein
MTGDPRWLEILKASGWQTAALAVASALLIFLDKKKVFTLDPRIVQGAIVGLVAFGCLSVATLASLLAKKSTYLTVTLSGFLARGEAKRNIEKEIPQLTATEREIIGYLLHHNQRMFTNTTDGGHAATLISKGIVVIAARPGQTVSYFEVPFEIPRPIWNVLVKHAGEFPRPDEGQKHPWRAHWMSR